MLAAARLARKRDGGGETSNRTDYSGAISDQCSKRCAARCPAGRGASTKQEATLLCH